MLSTKVFTKGVSVPYEGLGIITVDHAAMQVSHRLLIDLEAHNQSIQKEATRALGPQKALQLSRTNLYITHPTKPFHMLPRHPLQLGISKLRISLNQMLTILLQNSHGNANSGRVEGPGTLGSIFRNWILTTNDETWNVGHFDELSNRRFLVSHTFVAWF
jgi:hypothetical protein